MKEILIEKASVEELEEIFKVQFQSSIDAYQNEALGITQQILHDWRYGKNNEKLSRKIEKYRKYAENNLQNRALLVAKLGGKIVGISFPYIEEGGRHRLGALYVLKEVWGKGVGSKLMENALKWHDSNDVYLMVTSYNDRAIKFYERYGFQRTGVSVEEVLSEEHPDIKMPEFEMVKRFR